MDNAAVVRRLFVTLLVAVLAGSGHETAAQPSDETCDIRTSERVVAVGDVHGAFNAFVGILRAAQLINAGNRWIGGRAVLVQNGDVLDRGPDSRRAVDLLRRLESDAPRSGGQVVSLLGNHELMRITGDWRYVSAGELDAFRSHGLEQALDRARAVEGPAPGPAVTRDPFPRDSPLEADEMRRVFGPDGEYGRWVRERPTVARINGIVFLHGGISPAIAPLGCAGINAAVRREMAALPWPPEQIASLISMSETGPLLYRGLIFEPEETLSAGLETILDQMQARAMVVGHTGVPGRILVRFGGRVIGIDTGMLGGPFFPGGMASALEWHGDRVTIIFPNRRVTLPARLVRPAPVTTPAPASR
jgi:hypothetical protein